MSENDARRGVEKSQIAVASFVARPFTRVRTITFLLRVVAISAFLSGVTFYFPEQSINGFLIACGLPPMPHAPIMRYVLLAAGNLQIGIGVMIWVIARDPVRYQPIVLAMLPVVLISAPLFYLTNSIAGLPWYWCLLDFGCCFLAGGVPLLFCLWPAKSPPALKTTLPSGGSGNA